MDIIRNKMSGSGLDLSGTGQRPVADSREHGNEPSVSINDGKFLD
jgi:hypothetical protein